MAVNLRAFAGFAALIFVLACSVSSSRDEEATPLDWAGAGLIAGAVAVFVFGLLEAPARGWSHPLVCGSMVGWPGPFWRRGIPTSSHRIWQPSPLR
jgi:hypothetical protein